MFNRLLIPFILFLCLFLVQCVPDAPHSNPLDPDVPTNNSSGIMLKGEVLQKNPPHLPIDSCMIRLTPGKLFETSDASGQFQFTDLTAGTYQLMISRQGFVSDTVTIQTDTLKNSTLSFYLNGKPVLENISLFSEFIDQWWPDPYYRLIFRLNATDPDGPDDLEKVGMTIPELNINQSLQVTSLKDSFVTQLHETVFENNNIFEVVGKSIYIKISDKSQTLVTEGPYYIHRIIDRSPLPIEPTLQDTVNTSPVFHWQDFIALYTFKYEISVFLINAGVAVMIYSDQGIASDRNQYQYPDSLAIGNYYWTIGVRDALGNLSRSKEASFVVQSENRIQ